MSTRLPTGLPRARTLTDAMVAPLAPPPDPGSLAMLRTEVAGALSRIARGLPPGARVVLDSHQVNAALAAPEHCRPGRMFVPTASNCRRAVGLAAVQRCLRRRPPLPCLAVAAVLADGEAAANAGDPRAPWWAPWYARLAAGGRAAVAAEAITWATHLHGAFEWERFATPPEVGPRPRRWVCPTSPRFVVRGTADVRVAADGQEVVLVVGTADPGPHWRDLLALRAVAGLLARGPRGVPARVVGWWPASGQYRVLDVDLAVVRHGASSLAQAAAVWVEASAGAAGRAQDGGPARAAASTQFGTTMGSPGRRATGW